MTSTQDETPPPSHTPILPAATAVPATIATALEGPRRLAPRVVSYWRVKAIIVIACISVPALVVSFVSEWFTPEELGGWVVTGVGAALIAAVALAVLWPGLSYGRCSYVLDEHGLEIRHGVWWRQISYVPRNRVQHTDVNQGPLERHFGLAHLVVHTAGTSGAAVPLHGLRPETAQSLRQALAVQSSDDAV